MNLIEKILPLDRLLNLAMRFGLLRKPLELAAKVYKKAQGGRTQGALALAALAEIAGALGWIPAEAAHTLSTVAAGIALPTAIDKIARAQEALDKASAAVKAEAEKEK